MEHVVRVLEITEVSRSTCRLVLERPAGYRFEPGQAAELAVDTPAWREECRPFSFTSVSEDDYLEFHIRIYPSHGGVTAQIAGLNPGARMVLTEPFGTIRYRGEGYFIAGGTGITPFIAILRRLHRDRAVGANKLLYANRTADDIILEEEIERILDGNAELNLTHEPKDGYYAGMFDTGYFRRHAPETGRYFYVCGPDEMVRDIRDMLTYLGVSPQSIIVEE